MCIINRIALTSAAHNRVALEGTEANALILFFSLKAQSAADPLIQVGQLANREIPTQYDSMTVLALVEMIEHDAGQLVSFSNRVMDAAHHGLMDAVDGPNFELDASRWELSTFAEERLASEQSADVLEVVKAQELIVKLTALHPEKRWSLYPIGDYFQYAEADAPDVLVSFGCDDQDLESGLVDPYSTMMGELCEPAAWGISHEAAQLMQTFNKVFMAKYQNGDGPKLA